MPNCGPIWPVLSEHLSLNTGVPKEIPAFKGYEYFKHVVSGHLYPQEIKWCRLICRLSLEILMEPLEATYKAGAHTSHQVTNDKEIGRCASGPR